MESSYWITNTLWSPQRSNSYQNQADMKQISTSVQLSVVTTPSPGTPTGQSKMLFWASEAHSLRKLMESVESIATLRQFDNLWGKVTTFIVKCVESIIGGLCCRRRLFVIVPVASVLRPVAVGIRPVVGVSMIGVVGLEIRLVGRWQVPLGLRSTLGLELSHTPLDRRQAPPLDFNQIQHTHTAINHPPTNYIILICYRHL